MRLNNRTTLKPHNQQLTRNMCSFKSAKSKLLEYSIIKRLLLYKKQSDKYKQPIQPAIQKAEAKYIPEMENIEENTIGMSLPNSYTFRIQASVNNQSSIIEPAINVYSLSHAGSSPENANLSLNYQFISERKPNLEKEVNRTAEKQYLREPKRKRDMRTTPIKKREQYNRAACFSHIILDSPKTLKYNSMKLPMKSMASFTDYMTKMVFP